MLDSAGGISELRQASAEQGKADFGGRVLLEHALAGDDRLLDAAGEHRDPRFPPPCQFERRLERGGGVEIGFRLLLPAQHQMQPCAMSEKFCHVGFDRERGVEG